MPAGLKTDHPHVSRIDGVCGGEPIIDGLRVAVRHVAKLYNDGDTIAEIAESLNITEDQVVHGLSYYFDHRNEIDDLLSADAAA